MKKNNEKNLDYRYRLGQNIARIRKQETDFTHLDIELHAGISRAHYGKIELGTHAASVDTLIKIADVLQVPIYRLFLDENDLPI